LIVVLKPGRLSSSEARFSLAAILNGSSPVTDRSFESVQALTFVGTFQHHFGVVLGAAGFFALGGQTLSVKLPTMAEFDSILCVMRLFRVFRPRKILTNQQGLSLLLILIMVAVVSLSAAVAGSTWRTIMQRSREVELLFRGDQYRRALESYATAKLGGAAGKSTGGVGQLPTELEQLLKDPRFPEPRKHIRQLFLDPMTGAEFELIRTGGGSIGPIRGVRSTSELEPFKKDGFAKDYDKFKGAASYQSWEFVYQPPRPTGKQMPTGGMQTPAGGGLTPTSGAIPPPAGQAPPTSQPINPLLPLPYEPAQDPNLGK